jgi:MRN-interacting protein
MEYLAVQCYQEHCQVRQCPAAVVLHVALSHPAHKQAFQVTRTKKSTNKFTCKLCGSVQSVRGVHGRSAKAGDVRSVVSRLNAERHLFPDCADEEGDEEDENAGVEEPAPLRALAARGWSSYLPPPEEHQFWPPDDPRYVTAVPVPPVHKAAACGTKRSRVASAKEETEDETPIHRVERFTTAAAPRHHDEPLPPPLRQGRNHWSTFMEDDDAT